MPDLARDTFTDYAYRVLNLHPEEVNGAAWSGYSNSNQNLISPVGRIFRSAYNPLNGVDRFEGCDAFLGYTPPSANYSVQAELHWLGDYSGTGTPMDAPLSSGVTPPIMEEELLGGGGGANWTIVGPLGQERYVNTSGINNNPSAGTNHRFYIYARINPANKSQCYSFGYETAGSRYVLCMDQTDITSDGPLFTGWNLTTAAPAWTPGEMRLMEILVNGNTISGIVNGVTVLTTTQTTYSAAGNTGFELKGGSSPIRGFHVDNFKVLPLSSPPPTTTKETPLKILGATGIEVSNGCN